MMSETFFKFVEVKQAKMLFEAGALKSATIRDGTMTTDWEIFIVGTEKREFILKTQREFNRQFKTLDSAFRCLKDIGFSKANIETSRLARC